MTGVASMIGTPDLKLQLLSSFSIFLEVRSSDRLDKMYIENHKDTLCVHADAQLKAACGLQPGGGEIICRHS